jgi:molybdenum cofactor cytidylyltransferase
VIAAIVPAAGLSRRMGNGVQKLLLPLGEKPVIAHVVDQLLRVVDVIVVVTRSGDSAIATALADRPIHFAENAQQDGDMLSSIRAGLRALPSTCSGVLVAPADLPNVPACLLRRLIDAFSATPESIIVPVHDSRRGHPILFPADLRSEVLCRFDGLGLRGLLQALPEKVIEVRVESSAVVEDIDEPNDYLRALTESRGR